MAMRLESVHGKYELLHGSLNVAEMPVLSDGRNSETVIFPSVPVSCVTAPHETLPLYLFANLLTDVGGQFFVAYGSSGAVHCRKCPLS